MRDAFKAIELMNRLLEEAGAEYRVPASIAGETFESVIGAMMLGMAKLAELAEAKSSAAKVAEPPRKVRREVALYRWKKTDEPGIEDSGGYAFARDLEGPGHPSLIRISEPLEIEFTLLPGADE